MNSRKIVTVVLLTVCFGVFSGLAAELTANLDYSKCTPAELKKHLKSKKNGKKEVDLNVEGFGGTVVLLTAAKKTPYAEVIKILVSEQADVGVRDKDGMTALMLAVRYNPVAAVTKELIKSKVEIGTRNLDGQTAVMIAAKYAKTPEIIEYLLEAGANPKEKDFDGLTAFDIAKRAGNSIALDALTKNSFLSLNFATCTVKDIRARVKAGSDINEKDKNGATALLIAARDCRNASIIKTLIKSGADISATDRTGKNVTDYARQNNNSIAEKELVKAGAPEATKSEAEPEKKSVADDDLEEPEKKAESQKTEPEEPAVVEQEKAQESLNSNFQSPSENNSDSENENKKEVDSDNDDGLI